MDHVHPLDVPSYIHNSVHSIMQPKWPNCHPAHDAIIKHFVKNSPLGPPANPYVPTEIAKANHLLLSKSHPHMVNNFDVRPAPNAQNINDAHPRAHTLRRLDPGPTPALHNAQCQGHSNTHHVEWAMSWHICVISATSGGTCNTTTTTTNNDIIGRGQVAPTDRGGPGDVHDEPLADVAREHAVGNEGGWAAGAAAGHRGAGEQRGELVAGPQDVTGRCECTTHPNASWWLLLFLLCLH
ncbi:hypothetical protein Pelo_16865 [Pelomyxa schiedti]|nr:hypothetical protein Pelo_16865 [Pelomyxa schiedti]